MRGVVYRNGQFIPPFSGFFFGHFPAIFRPFFVYFFCLFTTLPAKLSFIFELYSAIGFVVTKNSLPANVVGKGGVLVAFEQDLEQPKDALGSRRIWRHSEEDTGQAPNLEAYLFLQLRISLVKSPSSPLSMETPLAAAM
jgi:hypothetical protein